MDGPDPFGSSGHRVFAGVSPLVRIPPSVITGAAWKGGEGTLRGRPVMTRSTVTAVRFSWLMVREASRRARLCSGCADSHRGRARRPLFFLPTDGGSQVADELSMAR